MALSSTALNSPFVGTLNKKLFPSTLIGGSCVKVPCGSALVCMVTIISKSIKVVVKMKNVSFILQKKTKWTFWSTQYFISENQWGTSESNSFFREGRECSRDCLLYTSDAADDRYVV